VILSCYGFGAVCAWWFGGGCIANLNNMGSVPNYSLITPSTAKRDIKTKFEIYQRHGVKEYWIMYPNDRTLLVYRLSGDNRYGAPEVFGEGDTVPVQLLGDLTVDMDKVFRM
jgi:Uma2 family endonuclease